MTQLIQIQTTTATRDDATRIADFLLLHQLAACVQISGPITSHYVWQDNREQSSEWLCIIKTRDALYREVEQAIRSQHPYQEPQIVALPIIHAATGYAQWVVDNTGRE
ncbi:MAG: divalent-cation tolerance protein CutA [Planctomycetaceae bacterium]|nr:divalent-cation tolerance protein CutA [Planctomycetaceae bacterium]